MSMSTNEILLVCAALLPAVALCVYVFKKDRVEKEPVGLLLLLLGLGALSCFPAAYTEEFIIGIIDDIFGSMIATDLSVRLYFATYYTVGVALVEEGFKFLIMYFITRKNKNFNSLFDGIVYAVFVSLGFAGLENIFYVLDYGWKNAIMRGIMSVPGHMFFGVIMGYYYSMWHMSNKAAEMERNLKSAGLLTFKAKEFSGRKFIILSLLVPVLIHGFYDYCCTIGTTLAVIALYALVIGLYIYCFAKISTFSKNDSIDSTYASIMVLKKYPFLIGRLTELYKNASAQQQESVTEDENSSNV